MTGKPTSRRKFLKLAGMFLGSATLAACSTSTPTPTPQPPTTAPTPAGQAEPTPAPEATSTPSATRPTPAPAVDVTITTSGWPVDRMPTQEEIEADKSKAGQAKALQAWLDLNPGVKIERVDVDIWDGQAIIPAISGGTAPTFVYAAAMGDWSLASARSVFVQGMVADITAFINNYGLQEKCLPNMWETWNSRTPVDGRHWAYPINEAAPSGTFHYRKDLVKELGLKEPGIDWTWEEARELFKGLTSEADNRRGFGAPTWMIGHRMDMYGRPLLTELPAPDAPWHWTLDFSDPRWVELITEYREMLFEEKCVLCDVALGGFDDEYVKLYHAGQIACARFNVWPAFWPETNENSIAAMARRLGKEYQEVAGILPYPRGDGYQSGGVVVDGGCSFSPDAKPEAIDKGISLIDWMFWAKGLAITKVAAYEATQDLKSVYGTPISMDGKCTAYEGVPGTFADAWGQDMLDRMSAMALLPVEPDKALYFPTEANPAPNSTAIDDAYSRFSTEPGAIDVAAELKAAQDKWLQAASGFASSISAADFKAAAVKYYADLDAFFKKNFAEWYESRFKPVYDVKIKLAIS